MVIGCFAVGGNGIPFSSSYHELFPGRLCGWMMMALSLGAILVFINSCALRRIRRVGSGHSQFILDVMCHCGIGCMSLYSLRTAVDHQHICWLFWWEHQVGSPQGGKSPL